MSSDDLPDPPPPPSIRRRIRLYRHQWIGIPILLAIPLLALAGVFGEAFATAEAHTNELDVTVRYPTRYRYKQPNRIEVHIRNTTLRTLDTLRVSLDSTYATRFSKLQSVPSFTGSFVVELTSLRPSEARLVMMEMQAERFGRHCGELRVIGEDTARVELRTFIFP